MRPFANSAFPDPDGQEVRRLAVRGAGITIFSGGLALAVQVIATVVLARLLTPRDFGLVAMVSTFSLLLANVGMNGITEAVVQRKEISNALASTLFWITLATGLVLSISFAAVGTLLARFYHDPLVQRITVALSPTIVLTSASVMHLALLKRAMKFSQVSANDIIARILSVAISIVLGVAGLGYWALVGGSIGLALSTTLGAWFLCRWLPSLPRKVEGTQESVLFAVHTYGRFSINYFTRNVDNLLVGWRFSAPVLGFYKKAYDLFALSATQLVGSITVVVVSALSRVKEDVAQYRRQFLGAMMVMAFIGMGLAADLTVIGRDVIRVLLGPGWGEAGHIFTYFAPGIGAMIVYHTHGWLHLSLGRPDRWFRWGVVEFVVTLMLFLAGLHWGPVGVAIGWTTSFLVLSVPALWYAGKPIGFEIGSILAVIWRYVLASLIAGVSAALLLGRVHAFDASAGISGALIRIVLGSLVVLSVYLGAIVLLHRGTRPLSELAALLREIVVRKRTSSTESSEPEGMNLREDIPDHGAGGISPEVTRKPLVSILIPAHNAEEWIADTLRSAVSQTWQPKEIIVVDDGSTDRTLDVVRRFGDAVQVFTQPRLGASAARNKALWLSHGEYIQWLDADDLLSPDKIALQMQVLLNEKTDRRMLVSCAYGTFQYRWYTSEFVPTELWRDLCPTEWLLRKMNDNLFMQTATWLVSREITDAAGSWDTKVLSDDDGEYFCRVLLNSDGVRFVPQAKVYYRSFGFNSLAYVGTASDKVDALWRSMLLHVRYLRSLEDSPRTRAACIAYLQRNLFYFYPERTEILQEAQQLAAELGGQLQIPPALPRKYMWIAAAFGWKAAKHACMALRRFRWSIHKQWEKTLFQIENDDSRPIGAA